jgi:hypothetical protein
MAISHHLLQKSNVLAFAINTGIILLATSADDELAALRPYPAAISLLLPAVSCCCDHIGYCKHL